MNRFFKQLIQWWLPTIAVIAGIYLLITLGNWQFDRLEQRQAENATTAAQLALPPLSLNEPRDYPDLKALETRRVTATGVYAYADQVTILHQNWQSQPGAFILTPLVFADGQTAVLVNRGWIPARDMEDPEKWAQYNLDAGETTAVGYVGLTETLRGKPNEIPSAPSPTWFRINLEGISAQLPYAMLPFYVQQIPDEGTFPTDPPIPTEPEFDLTDGPHLSYALQWYAFAIILVLFYLWYIYKKVTPTPENK